MEDWLDTLLGDGGDGSSDGAAADGGASLSSALERAAGRAVSSSLRQAFAPRRRRALSHGHARVAQDHYGLALTRLQSTAGLARLLQRANRNM